MMTPCTTFVGHCCRFLIAWGVYFSSFPVLGSDAVASGTGDFESRIFRAFDERLEHHQQNVLSVIEFCGPETFNSGDYFDNKLLDHDFKSALSLIASMTDITEISGKLPIINRMLYFQEFKKRFRALYEDATRKMNEDQKNLEEKAGTIMPEERKIHQEFLGMFRGALEELLLHVGSEDEFINQFKKLRKENTLDKLKGLANKYKDSLLIRETAKKFFEVHAQLADFVTMQVDLELRGWVQRGKSYLEAKCFPVRPSGCDLSIVSPFTSNCGRQPLTEITIQGVNTPPLKRLGDTRTFISIRDRDEFGVSIQNAGQQTNGNGFEGASYVRPYGDLVHKISGGGATRVASFIPFYERASWVFYNLLAQLGPAPNDSYAEVIPSSCFLLCQLPERDPPRNTAHAQVVDHERRNSSSGRFILENHSLLSQFGECKNKPFMLQCSRKVPGMTLREFLQPAKGLPLFEEIDPLSYTALVLGGLLMSPSDYHSQNFIIEDPKPIDRGRRIVAVDNDRFFGLDDVGEGEIIQHKNILYLFPLMDKVMDQGIFEALKQLPQNANLIFSWLSYLCKHAVEYNFLEKDQAYCDALEELEGAFADFNAIKIDRMFGAVLPVSGVEAMFTKYEKLMSFLRSKGEAPTLNEIFQELMPSLCTQYHSILLDRKGRSIPVLYDDVLHKAHADSCGDLHDVHSIFRKLELGFDDQDPGSPQSPLRLIDKESPLSPQHRKIYAFPSFPLDKDTLVVHSFKAPDVNALNRSVPTNEKLQVFLKLRGEDLKNAKFKSLVLADSEISVDDFSFITGLPQFEETEFLWLYKLPRLNSLDLARLPTLKGLRAEQLVLQSVKAERKVENINIYNCSLSPEVFCFMSSIPLQYGLNPEVVSVDNFSLVTMSGVSLSAPVRLGCREYAHSLFINLRGEDVRFLHGTNAFRHTIFYGGNVRGLNFDQAYLSNVLVCLLDTNVVKQSRLPNSTVVFLYPKMAATVEAQL